MFKAFFSRMASQLPTGFSLLSLLCLCGLFSVATPVQAALHVSHVVSTSGAGVNGVQVFVEPAAGEQVIVNAISGAKSSVYVELYLLTDTNVINALEQVAKAGRDVRVMLEPHPYGGGSPDATLKSLSAAGVQTAYTSPDFSLTHEKSMIIDSARAYIMTCNLTKSALGGSSSTKNREYGIIDANAADVKTVSDIFNADWKRTAYTLDNANIVLSPTNARSDFSALINSAQSTLLIEAEEMQDSGIEQAIVNAKARGVEVEVILPYNDSGNSAGISTLHTGGVQVKSDKQLYMHAKIIIVDGKEAFVGSENISSYSLDKNRELGLLVADTKVLSTLTSSFKTDWSASVAA